MVEASKPHNSSSGGKRTNSLAFATIDCHTCATLGEKCDRRRPKCSQCLGQGHECGGFATALSWDSKRMFSCNPMSTTLGVAGHTSNQVNDMLDPLMKQSLMPPSQSPDPPVRFRFVGDPTRRRKRRKTASTREDRASKCQGTLQKENADAPADSYPISASENPEMTSAYPAGDDMDFPTPVPSGIFSLDESDICDSLIPPVFDSTFWLDFETPETFHAEPTDLVLMPNTTIPTTDTVTGTISEEDSNGCQQAQEVGNIAPDVAHAEILNGEGMSLPCTAPPIPMATTILEFSYNDHGWLFELYDSELCVLPLTSDIAINPFRCKIPAQQGSRVLFHAVLALCYRHLNHLTCNWSDEVTAHHGKAIQLLESALQGQQSRNSLQLLEPILILFTLDCTLSATGLWSIHLQRAYSLLQACGGPVCLDSQRTRSQVGMLLWWDATLALISRRCPVLDRPYLDYLVQWEQQDDWSFFDLTGCPRDLFVILYNLAEMARQSEIAASMKWLTFDLAPVFEVEQRLRQWKNDLDPLLQKEDSKLSDAEADKKLHELQDRYHCAEAWRCALLLYIESVFKREGARSPFSLALLVRKTLDHIRCCRQSSQTQKQLLLPVFIAGSETSDSDMRDFVTGFCRYWGDKSRYSMFNSVPTLLDEIWSTGNWWGTVIDGRTTSKASSSDLEQNPTQVLLG